MSAYINGSLAIDERRKGANTAVVRTKAAQKKELRLKSIPTSEKLLYLFAILTFSIIAGIVIWRYAMIFELNTRVVQMESQIQQLEKENTELKNEVARLQDPQRLIESGIQYGLMLPDEIAPSSAKVEGQAVATAQE